MTDVRNTKPSLQSGVELIAAYAQVLPNTPGVYRMIGARNDVLYVGKAKALKKRVMSYTHPARLPLRLQRMIAATQEMVFVHTHTEAEALLLESNLIKKLKPRYNILLRDDKSFPYILLTGNHDFPQIVKHRGARKKEGAYYGPFAGTGDVNRTIAILQRIFMLRNCSDSYFAGRNRPCLQHHIKRCTAPCVGLVSKEVYARQIENAQEFLEGKNAEVQVRMAERMQEASAKEDYENAALYRDRIKALSAIQARQDVNVENVRDADVIALAQENGQSCVQVFFFRGGRNYGNRAYFPRHDMEEDSSAVLNAFLAQFYENKELPKEIIVSELPDEKTLLEDAFSKKSKVKIVTPQRGDRRRILDFAMKNALVALKSHMAEKAGEAEMLKEIAALFEMEEQPKRIEVYDNSHISGTNMVGAMVVAGAEGFLKAAYRKFNIKRAVAGDDYGMMKEVMERRFKQGFTEGEAEEFPDLLLIDGGKGQLGVCRAVLEEYGLLDHVTLVAISKGPDRNAGREQFHMCGRAAFQLPEKAPVLYYLQRLRDEAHSFAIMSHRARRQKQVTASPLDDIPGIGAKRKKALLLYFGSAKAVAAAGVEDLEKTEGISKAIAQKIYDYFH